MPCFIIITVLHKAAISSKTSEFR